MNSEFSKLLQLAETGSAACICDSMGPNPPIKDVVRVLSEAELKDHHREAIYRELLLRFPLHPDWDEVDANGGPSIETILLTVRDLRWDIREVQEEALLQAVRQRPWRENLDLSWGIKLATQKPATLGTGGWSETIQDSELSSWKPKKINLESLRLENCTGPLELGASMKPVDPEDYCGRNVLEISPDLEVRNSAPSLEGMPVQRTFAGKWKASYFLPMGCDGWIREQLDSSGMDLTMPVVYDDLSTTEQVQALPLGAVTVMRWGPLALLPEGWKVPGCLELYGLENLETLPDGFQIRPQQLTRRCDHHCPSDLHPQVRLTETGAFSGQEDRFTQRF